MKAKNENQNNDNYHNKTFMPYKTLFKKKTLDCTISHEASS